MIEQMHSLYGIQYDKHILKTLSRAMVEKSFQISTTPWTKAYAFNSHSQTTDEFDTLYHAEIYKYILWYMAYPRARM